MRPDINKLSKDIYEANKLKGWHDQEYSNEHYLCLVISELMEAVEADRKWRRSRLFVDEKIRKYHFKLWFETNVKDTIEDELADAVIRLLDLAGVRDYDVKIQYQYHADLMNEVLENCSFIESVYFIVERITTVSYFESHEAKVRCVITYIDSLCENLYIDLWQHVQLKMQYNKSIQK